MAKIEEDTEVHCLACGAPIKLKPGLKSAAHGRCPKCKSQFWFTQYGAECFCERNPKTADSKPKEPDNDGWGKPKSEEAEKAELKKDGWG
jgi:hypothetical protein